MRLGLDFGTTNSSISYYDGKDLFRIHLDPANDSPYVLPSLLYIDRKYAAVVGTEAAREYLKRETGRPVRWERRRVGEIEVTASEMSYIRDVHVMTDVAANGRLLQSVKTGLRDGSYEGTQIFDRFYTLDELIAILLRAIKASAEQHFGQECTEVVIGRPVRFADDPAVTGRGEEILFTAARFAGFKKIRFQMEPIGVAYLHHRSSSQREIVLVFDFGGGTLDLTVAELGGTQPPKILATRGVLVGGDDLDRRIMQSLLKYFGAKATVAGDRGLPPHVLELLESWQTMPELSRGPNRRLINDLKKTTRDRRAIHALETLATRNLGFKLFTEIERAKKRLSTEPATTLDFVHDNIQIHERITRPQFEVMIRDEMSHVREGVWQVLDDAGLAPSQIDVVLRTGGTSAVPAFTRLLALIFGEEKLREMDLLTSVVGGLAVVAHEEAGWEPAYAARYALNPVSDVRAAGAAPYEPYEMRIGNRCYVDQPFTLSRIPITLSGLPAIRTAMSDRNASADEVLRFHLSKPARVYVAYDATAKSLPEWLRSFTPEEMQVEVDQWGTGRLFHVYGRDFAPGPVVLGGNHGVGYGEDVFMNYLVVVKLLA
jgi:hypothetical chaperone protein